MPPGKLDVKPFVPGATPQQIAAILGAMRAVADCGTLGRATAGVDCSGMTTHFDLN